MDYIQENKKKLYQPLYPFWKSNIHEDRHAARFFRALPLVTVIALLSLTIYAATSDLVLLLIMAAFFNVSLWIWLVSTSIVAIYGTYMTQDALERCKDNPDSLDKEAQVGADKLDSVQHVIVVPNYKEEETLLQETLLALSEAEGSKSFRLVLAMEAREEGSAQKAARLQQQFQDRFAKVDLTLHPGNLEQEHNDGGSSPEIPGKASNLRWAVAKVYENLDREGQISLASVMVTVADADVVFHPSYFSYISKEFNVLRSNPGNNHEWTLWQAPQLSFRNHWEAPVCSRTWSYVAAMYEFGGVSWLKVGGHHMVFSAYSLPLLLAHKADSWDGDCVAEDHHCFCKNFFYSIHTAAKEEMESGFKQECLGHKPKTQVKPVFLPVKSTPVISSEGYWQSYVERWYQAKRHAQGMAELSYVLLATYDMLCTLPRESKSWALFMSVGRVVMRLFLMQLLPVLQAICFLPVMWIWMTHSKEVPLCPKTMRLSMILESDYIICGLAGTWTLVWPVVVPMILLMVANYLCLSCSFITPARHDDKAKQWYREDGDFQARGGSKWRGALLCTVIDCTFFLMPMLVPYGFLVVFIALWNVAFYGNEITYISASKVTRATSSYGTMDASPGSQEGVQRLQTSTESENAQTSAEGDNAA